MTTLAPAKNLGYVLLGDPGSAVPHPHDSVRLAPRDPDLRVQFAACSVKLGHLPEAIAELRVKMQSAPDDLEAQGLMQQLRAVMPRKEVADRRASVPLPAVDSTATSRW